MMFFSSKATPSTITLLIFWELFFTLQCQSRVLSKDSLAKVCGRGSESQQERLQNTGVRTDKPVTATGRGDQEDTALLETGESRSDGGEAAPSKLVTDSRRHCRHYAERSSSRSDSHPRLASLLPWPSTGRTQTRATWLPPSDEHPEGRVRGVDRMKPRGQGMTESQEASRHGPFVFQMLTTFPIASYLVETNQGEFPVLLILIKFL